jgi:Bacterial protein of unknown function (DUF945)
MKKTLAAAAAIAGVLGAVGGVSAWSGRAVTQRLQLQTTRLGKMFPAFKVLDEEVDHGLFSTTRTLRVQLGCVPADPAKALADPPQKPVPLELRIRDEVKHGPFPGGRGLLVATVDTRLLPPAQWQAKLDPVLAGQPLLHAETQIDFGGKLVSEVKLPGIKLDDPAQGRFESSPLLARISVEDGAGGASKYSVAIPKLSLRVNAHGEALAFELGAFQSQGEIAPQPDLSPWLSPGKTHGTLASFELSGSAPGIGGAPGKPLHARFEALEFDAETAIDKGLWSAKNRLRFKGKVDALAIDKIELAASFKRVHAASYDKLLSGIFGTALDCEPGAQQAALATLFPGLRKQLAEVLVHDPEYALDSLAIELGGKRAELTYAVGTRGVTAADLDGDLGLLLMQKGVLRASAKVHFELLVDLVLQGAESMPPGAGAVGLRPGEREQATVFASSMLAPLVQSGYAVRDGDFITVSSVLEGGKLLVNGKPMALPDLASGLAP